MKTGPKVPEQKAKKQPISKMLNSNKSLANTIWREEKDKAIFHTGSSDLQVCVSKADIFPSFNRFFKKNKLKPNNLKTTPLIPNSLTMNSLHASV